MTYNPRTIKVGDWLVIKPDYDKRKGRHSVQVRAIFDPCRSQSGIAFDVGFSNGTQWESKIDADWFEGKEISPSQDDWLNSVQEPMPTQEQVDEWMKELPW